MALNLKKEVETLQSTIAELCALDFIKNATGTDQEQVARITDNIVKTISDINREANSLDVAMEARDANIRALGEKLSVLRMKHAKPFIVNSAFQEVNLPDGEFRKRSPSELRRKSLFWREDTHDWNKDDTDSHMRELSEQIARLSLIPMGLSRKDLEEQVADVSATRLYEGKAINLIKVAKARGLADDRIRRFLTKKGLPEITINRCFNMTVGSPTVVKKQMPQLPKLANDQEQESDTEDMEEYDFSSVPRISTVGPSPDSKIGS